MRALHPDVVNEVDVHEWYARNWVDDGGVRLDFVSSVDGAASAGDQSAGLQTPGDNRVFAAMRDLADVVLVGAGTVRAEGYRPARLSDRRRAVRREHGFAEALPIAVVSRNLTLDPASPLFTDAPQDARTVLITCAASPDDARNSFERVAEVVVAGDDEVDPVAARAALEQRGFRRILCEGGPLLFAQLAEAGVMDELCLSVTPFLAGPGAPRITAGHPWGTAPMPLDLTHVLEEDSALFLRYAVRR